MVAPGVIAGIIGCLVCTLCSAFCLASSEAQRQRDPHGTEQSSSCCFGQRGRLSREDVVTQMQMESNAMMAEADRIDRLEAFIKRSATEAAENQLNGVTPKPATASVQQPAPTVQAAYLHPAVARQLAAARPIYFQPGCGPSAANPMAQTVPMGPYGPMCQNRGVPGYFYQ